MYTNPLIDMTNWHHKSVVASDVILQKKTISEKTKEIQNLIEPMVQKWTMNDHKTVQQSV